MAKSKYEKSLEETLAMRRFVPAEFHPLFDSCIERAASAHRHGAFKLAGRDLRYARGLVKYAPK